MSVLSLESIYSLFCHLGQLSNWKSSFLCQTRNQKCFKNAQAGSHHQHVCAHIKHIAHHIRYQIARLAIRYRCCGQLKAAAHSDKASWLYSNTSETETSSVCWRTAERPHVPFLGGAGTRLGGLFPLVERAFFPVLYVIAHDFQHSSRSNNIDVDTTPGCHCS